MVSRRTLNCVQTWKKDAGRNNAKRGNVLTTLFFLFHFPFCVYKTTTRHTRTCKQAFRFFSWRSVSPKKCNATFSSFKKQTTTVSWWLFWVKTIFSFYISTGIMCPLVQGKKFFFAHWMQWYECSLEECHQGKAKMVHWIHASTIIWNSNYFCWHAAVAYLWQKGDLQTTIFILGEPPFPFLQLKR